MGLHATLRAVAAEHPEVPAVIAGSRATFAAIADQAAALVAARPHLAGQAVAVAIPPSPAFVAALVALDALGADAWLIDPDLPAADRDALLGEFGLGGFLDAELVLHGRGVPAGHRPGAVVMLTSGTTGRPKAVRHTWASLMRPTRVHPRFAGTRWLLTQPPRLYAGLQVLLQALLNGASAVVSPPGRDPDAILRTLLDHGVQYVSATPSFWRRLLAFGDREALSRVPLRQITLGGEAATAGILDALARTFPQARIVHIYATSELGRCFTVPDGRPGFPAAYLDHPPEEGVGLRIVDGVLEVRSANRMAGYDPRGGAVGSAEGWFRTGDRVEVRDDRVVFLGRDADLINVGGNKVSPVEVEQALADVPGLAEIRVHAVSSSLAGQLVAADLAVTPGADPAAVRKAVAARAAEVLQPWQRPRRLNLVSQLDLTPAGKVIRRDP